jgi:hypothetical protein
VIVVLALLFVSYAGSLRAFLAQRAHIDELETQIAQDQAAAARLREERRRWTDEAFIEAQARERFGWVMPGEVGFRVIGKDGEPLDAASQLTDPSTLGDDPSRQWWSTTWGSIRVAGEEPEGRPAPALRLGPRPKPKHHGGGGGAGGAAGAGGAGGRQGGAADGR